jgi:hypothetical protein
VAKGGRMKEEKPLLLFLMSLKPHGMGKRALQHRESDYSASLIRLKQLGILKSRNVIICENTCSSVADFLDSNLGGLANELNISISPVNEGSKNKGAGELSMALKAYKDFPELFEATDNVEFMSGRHILASPGLFHLASELKKDALVGNPDFFFLTGEIHLTEKNGMYNDMFFAMRKEFFLGYLNYFSNNKSEMIEKMINSESLLYKFCKLQNLELQWVDHFGLMRRDSRPFFRFWRRSTWHLC